MCDLELNFGKVKIKIACDDPNLIDFIRLDTHPYFSEDCSLKDYIKLNLTFKRQDLSSIEIPKESKRIILHPRDTPLYGYVWYENGFKVIYNPHYKSLIKLDEYDAQIYYEGNYFNGFISFRMLVFPTVYILSDLYGTLTLHSSAVEKNGEAVIFCGPKGAGKTTCALSLALVSGFGFITNECSNLKLLSDNSINVSGTPEAIRLGDGTFNALKEYFEVFKESNFVVGKRHILLREYKKFYPIEKNGNLRAITLINLVTEGELKIKPLSIDDAKSFLKSQVQEIYKRKPYIWNIIDKLEVSDDKIFSLLSNIPIYELTVPYEAVGDKVLSQFVLDNIYK